jgi:branched-chain amino acid transport system ATP-binding protein
VADNLHLGGAAHASGEELKKRVEAELDRFPILRERYHQKAGLLSGGEQQMLAIARSLMAGPRLLLLDEPSLGLAPLIVDKVFDLILDLKRRGLTILLVEQNAERALEIADHGYVLQTGQVVLEGTGAELARSDLVKQAYLAG